MSPIRRAVADSSRIARRCIAIACTVGAALLPSACATGSSTGSGGGLDFSTPTPPSDAPVDVASGSVGSATSGVAARLQAAGITVASVNAGAGTIRARSGDNALVNCGEITQSLDGNRATFPGSAPSAVIFAFGQPGDIMLREVETETAIDITVRSGAPNTASIRETHEVTIRQLTADRSQTLWSQAESFDGRSVVTFGDGTLCTSSDAVRRIIG